MFADDRRGSIAAIFAFALPALLIGVGGVIETSRAVTLRSRLASAVELSCTHAQAFVNARKPEDIKAGDLEKTYPKEVSEIALRNFAGKNLGSVVPLATNTDTSVRVEASTTMPLLFAGLLNKDGIPLSVQRDCPVMSASQAAMKSTKPELLVTESFERPSHGVSYDTWAVLGTAANGRAWNGWTTTAGGIEINGQRQLASNAIRFGDFFAELDSDCENRAAVPGTPACRSNSTMSRILNLTAGNYVIRYWYIARLRDPARPGQVICGQKDSDVSWYQYDGQTNRIEVFVEKSGSYTFAAANMVDVCVQSDTWIERVIRFTVKDASEYRISWRAAGREDAYGGLIDNLRICRNDCPL
ncbi:TadE/TadG family type IV pilus assembly protein [Methylobacterium planeticum]|uniref:Putative Flp pilus-assembly TadG-like N-terminal domain-containing protein n=1 Tax=Methylobacterium planeticum TaxID=2615211 RepID=A0A6N6MNI3_9HYPH|nr:pilus assembly protein TadG-related protein [Methylobacterium planeticum]KAB1072843.1 hypothetical protein F6X51_14685 [Methylobacterium planeticum]